MDMMDMSCLLRSCHAVIGRSSLSGIVRYFLPPKCFLVVSKKSPEVGPTFSRTQNNLSI